MGILDSVRRLLGGNSQPPAQEVVGTITDKPKLSEGSASGEKMLVFHLDSRPELEFRQPSNALASDHKRGDRVKVTCHVAADGVATVEWIEKV